MLTYVPPPGWTRQPGLTTRWGSTEGSPYSIGLDLGQSQDFSALVIVQHFNRLPPGYGPKEFDTTRSQALSWHPGGTHPPALREMLVVHAQRWPLGTGYHEIVQDVIELGNRPELAYARFMYDRSGVGRAVGDLLGQAWLNREYATRSPYGVTITSGAGPRSKQSLIDALLMPLQQGRIAIADIPLGPELKRELGAFQTKQTAAGTLTFDAARRAGEGHADMATALMRAVREPDVQITPIPRFAN